MQHFGRADSVEDFGAEARLPAREEVAGERLARRDAQAQAFHVRLVFRLQHRGVQGRDAEEDGRPSFGDVAVDDLRRRPIGRKDGAGADPQREGERVAEAVCVEEFGSRVATVVRLQLEDPAAVQLAAVRPVLVRMDSCFRLAGGAAGPQPEGGLVAAGRRGLQPLLGPFGDERFQIDAGHQHPLVVPGQLFHQRRGSHHQRGARLLEKVSVVGGAQERIAGHGHRADLHRRQIAGRQLRRVGHHHQHPLLRLHAGAQECRSGPIDQHRQLRIGQRLPARPARRPLPAPLAQVPLDQLRPDVEHPHRAPPNSGTQYVFLRTVKYVLCPHIIRRSRGARLREYPRG